MAIVGNLVVAMQARTEDFDRGLQRARRELQQTQQAVTQSQSSFAGLSTSMTGLAAGVVSFTAITAGIRSVVTAGVQLGELRGSFAAIAGSAHLGAQEFAFLATTANKLGLDLQSLGEQYRSLSASTRGTALAGQETRDLFTALSTASRAYGLSTEATGRALTALAQILSKGKCPKKSCGVRILPPWRRKRQCQNRVQRGNSRPDNPVASQRGHWFSGSSND